MRYRELLKLYKEGRLNETQNSQVEADIEKQEAISEYLFEREEKDGIGLAEDTGHFYDDEKLQDDIQPDFVRMVNRSIRRAFIKTGAAVAVFALAAVLFVMFLLPKAVDSLYYDPGASTGAYGNRMSLDLSVYTELQVPGYNRDTVTVQGRGYGNYDIMIPQWISYNGTMTNLSGRVSKGNLILYDPNLLNPPVMNVFAWCQIKGDSSDSLTDLIDQKHQVNSCAAGNRADAKQALERLDENVSYVAYVTLDKMMPYETFIAALNRLENDKKPGHIWCAVCTDNGIAGAGGENDPYFRAENLGFHCELHSSHMLDWDREKYPQLVLFDQDTIEKGMEESQREALQKEDFAKTHFTSMLRYLADQESFCRMMEDRNDYRRAADYVEKNGLMVYGFAGIGTKEIFLELNKEEWVYEIYTQILR